MHRAQYVLSCVPVPGLKVLTPLISPTVPMETRSSVSHPGTVYLRAMCAAKRRLCSMSFSRATRSPPAMRSSSSASSSRVSGLGNALPLAKYPSRNSASLRKNSNRSPNIPSPVRTYARSERRMNNPQNHGGVFPA